MAKTPLSKYVGERIVQVMPAPGWSAKYEDGDVTPLVCWAVIEWENDEGDIISDVVGMVMVQGSHRLDFCGPRALDSNGFVEYVWGEQ